MNFQADSILLNIIALVSVSTGSYYSVFLVCLPTSAIHFNIKNDSKNNTGSYQRFDFFTITRYFKVFKRKHLIEECYCEQENLYGSLELTLKLVNAAFGRGREL